MLELVFLQVHLSLCGRITVSADETQSREAAELNELKAPTLNLSTIIIGTQNKTSKHQRCCVANITDSR